MKKIKDRFSRFNINIFNKKKEWGDFNILRELQEDKDGYLYFRVSL